MRVHFQRMFAAMLVIVCIGAPALEMFDRWDRTLQDGNDTEGDLVVVVLCVGIGLITAAAILRCVRPPATRTCLQAAFRPFNGCLQILVRPVPHASPPTILRV